MRLGYDCGDTQATLRSADGAPLAREYDPTFGKRGFALRAFTVRFHDLRMTQRQFSERFGFGLGSLRDLEQMRGTPSRAARVLIEAINLDPGLIERAAEQAKRWGRW